MARCWLRLGERASPSYGSDAQLIPKPGSYQTFENAYYRRILESRSSPATDHRPGLALVPVAQLGVGEASELILDDDSVGFLDVFLIEQVLQLKDPSSRVAHGNALPQPSQNEGREAVETAMTPGTK